MREASPEARALAGLAASLFDLAIFAMAGFALVDLYASPQDLPWKPLSIADPIGLATTAKFERTVAKPADCLAFLKREGVSFTPAPERSDGGFCEVKAGVRMGPQGARLSPAAPVMTCRLGAAFAIWTRQVVEPAARDALGQDVAAVEHFGTYSCRRIYGRASGPPSQHAQAQAVDISGFRLADGGRVSVRKDWDDPGPKGRFLHRIRDEGCRIYRVALSPDYNAAHHDHLHFDMSPYRLCR